MSPGQGASVPPSKIDWAVAPKIGVGPLRLGMSPEEVAAILGEPVKRIEKAKGFLEFRETIPSKLPVLLFEAGKLVMIDFVKQTRSLRLDDLYLFKLKRQETIDALTERATTVFEDFEGYHFLDFGLSMSSAKNFRSEANIGLTKPRYFEKLRQRQLDGGRGRYVKGGA